MAEDLADIARRYDKATSYARAELVGAVRRAAAQGMTQSRIAQQIGRSQPEISRLPTIMTRIDQALAEH